MGDASGMDGSAQSSKPEAVKAQRRKWTMAERQRMVQASLKAGTTVESVARVYGVNPSQIHKWRKQHRQRMQQQSKHSALLPVQVAEGVAAGAPQVNQECSVILEARGVRVTVSGCVDAAVICRLLEYLAG
jgi:transposase-like protein